MIQKSSTNSHQRQHEVKTKQVPLHELPTAIRHTSTPRAPDIQLCMASKQVQRDPKPEWPGEVQQIVQYDGYRDDEGLRCLGPVDACEDVDAVCAERRQQRHVEVVEGSEVDESAEEPAEGERDHDVRVSPLGIVDHEEGYGGDDGDGQFVSPADVEDVVQESEHGRD